MKVENLRELLVDELRDLYSAETQLTKALPKVAKHASDSKLKQAVDQQLVLRVIRGQGIAVEELNEDSFPGIDIALFSAGSTVSRRFAPIAVRQGVISI